MNRKKLILFGMLYIAFSITLVGFFANVEPAEAQSTVYIRANGSVEPLSAPIATFDNITYTFTGNIGEPLVVQRSNIVVDVAGFAIEGAGGGTGVGLTGISNVTVKNANIRGFYYGIAFNSISLSGIYSSNITDNSYDSIFFSTSWDNTISQNNITANGNDGIKLNASDHNVISENNIGGNNDDGIQLTDSLNNSLSRNNILANNDVGIFLSNSANNSLDGNQIVMNRHGIELSSSQENTLFRNKIQENGWSGIRLSSSNGNSIVENNVTDNYDGIYAYACSGTYIYGNNITENTEYGLWLDSSSTNSVIGNGILSNYVGVYVYRISSSNSIYENRFAANDDGILISGSSNNIISVNIIQENQNGVRLVFGSSGNRLFHNNLLDNVQQASAASSNSWDNSLEGNFWSDYAGADLNNDGLGDVPINLATGNVDRFPLMGLFRRFITSPGPYVNVISNSTIDDFIFNKSPAEVSVTMHISNTTVTQAVGFCRVAISHILMTEPYNVTIDGAQPSYANYTTYDNSTHRWIYFNYNHSTLEVIIQGKETTPPGITILSPENTTYPTSDVPLTFTIDEPAFWIGYSLDSQTNETITGNTTLIGLSEGPHNIILFANDTADNMGTSDRVYFSVDTVSPNVTILSPQNQTYATGSLMLTFTINEPASWIGYSLNGQTNVTIAGNTTLSGLPDGLHSIVVYANDTAGNMASSDTVYFTIARGLLISILSPENTTYAISDVTLTFTINETTSWIGYSLDGQDNVTITGNTTMTGLSDGGHHVIIYANNTFGNMGSSDPIYFSVDTVSPNVTILSPQNQTYATGSLMLTFTINEPASWIGYSLNGQTNVTIAGNTTLSGLPDGLHSIVVYANDTAGNMASSDPVDFSVDTTPPTITILSPLNQTYQSDSISLVFTLDEPTSLISYSLDGKANVTILGNSTIFDLTDGNHNVVVYAADAVGNMGSSALGYFSVDTTPPDITSISQYPPDDSVLPYDRVEVNATITDNFSGTSMVICNYTTNNGTWFSVEMAPLEGNIWNATIPGFPYCTTVNYTIIAEDNVGNRITSEELAYALQYHVVPEFPSYIALLLLMAAPLIMLALHRSKRIRTKEH